MAANNHSFIYNVEILIEDKNQQQALIQMLQKLNSLNVIDYKITSGIQLGNEIEARKQTAAKHEAIPILTKHRASSSASSTKVKAEAIKETSLTSSEIEEGIKLLKSFKDQNKLIRLIVNRGLGIKLSIPCRVLNMDETGLISVYHVDEKQVYTFRLNEIEDFEVV